MKKNVSGKNILGLNLAEICTDGASIYKCDTTLAKAFDQVAFSAGFSKGATTTVSSKNSAELQKALFPYLNVLGLKPWKDTKAINFEAYSRWVRAVQHPNGSQKPLLYAAVVDAYLSRELLRLRVFLGGANKDSIEWGIKVSIGLAKFFSKNDTRNAVKVNYDGQTRLAIVHPAHNLSLVLANAEQFYSV